MCFTPTREFYSMNYFERRIKKRSAYVKSQWEEGGVVGSVIIECEKLFH